MPGPWRPDEDHVGRRQHERAASDACDLKQRRVGHGGFLMTPVGNDAADGRPGLGRDPMCRVKSLQCGLLEVRMDLDLIHSGHDGCRKGFSKIVGPLMASAMRRANRKDLSRLKVLLERSS
jgi:hypothetical protein